MTSSVRELEGLVNEWMLTCHIPEVEWSRIRALNFQEIYRSRDILLKNLTSKDCMSCDAFKQHVCLLWPVRDVILTSQQYALVHEEKVLLAKIANLKLAISEQNLELIPDYEQRIEVLKELKFIDESSTVLLKGHVACEVRILDFFSLKSSLS
jgi:antiviral helicase SKI2